MLTRFLLGAAGVAAVGLILFGKYKLARASLTLPVILLGGLVFAISNPAKADASTTARPPIGLER